MPLAPSAHGDPSVLVAVEAALAAAGVRLADVPDQYESPWRARGLAEGVELVPGATQGERSASFSVRGDPL